LPVASLEAALGWYERFLGRPPDLRPNATEACWRFAEGRWVYVMEEPERAGGGLVTLLLDDASGFEGLDYSPVGGMESAWVTDPDGNRLQIVNTRSAS
jgi:catechol 2,3-dioxygenase-like lactoylglutathione lyase family enzyme